MLTLLLVNLSLVVFLRTFSLVQTVQQMGRSTVGRGGGSGSVFVYRLPLIGSPSFVADSSRRAFREALCSQLLLPERIPEYDFS